MYTLINVLLYSVATEAGDKKKEKKKERIDRVSGSAKPRKKDRVRRDDMYVSNWIKARVIVAMIGHR